MIPANPKNEPIIIALLGPTGVGKTRIATAIAPCLGAEIVSVDSMQVYRGMDIGTAKVNPGASEAVPHHMIDIVDHDKPFSVADFQKAGRMAVRDILARGKLPFLVGGSGLYFEALVFEMDFPPGIADSELRRSIEQWAREDPEGLRSRLREVDPQFAAGEGWRNIRRVMRAMEVYQATGRPFSSFNRNRPTACHPFRGAVLDMERSRLYRLIDLRVDKMIEAGLIEEVRDLERRSPLSMTARQALGYKEILEYLEGRSTLEEAIAEIKKRSRRYAKRQVTWFRHIPGLRWFEMFERHLNDPGSITDELLHYYSGK
jgi:tRNA dimethylallyltransferase